MPELQQSANQVITPRTNFQEFPQFGMWVGFLYIIYFISLYVWATSFGYIVHEIVNRYVPDALEIEEARRVFGYFGDNIIRWSLASLIIFYPVFVFTHILIQRLKLRKPEIVNIRARKILIYITLIGTFWVSSFQLVKFIYAFLDGSVSTRTISHFAVTTAIASVIFVLYFFEVRKDRR